MSKKVTEIPFWGVFIDCYPHLMQTALDEDFDAITDEQWWTIVRWWRNVLLNESDWSQVADNSLTEEQRETWREYRRELRDVTNTSEDPKEIAFPDLP